jgi:transposase
MLSAEADDLETELALLVAEHVPELLAEPGVGTISAAQVVNAWSHAGRIRSEAAFAMLSGSAPVPASSGKVVRHRLNRSGDRQLNRALHTVVLSRMRFHAETKEYVARRTAEGRTSREIKRCLKRYVARRLFRLLEADYSTSKPVLIAA